MRSWVLLCGSCCSLGPLLGCGGKIVESSPLSDTMTFEAPPSGDRTASEQDTREPPPPGRAAPATFAPIDACEVLCERDARCDTTLPALPVKEGETADCKTRCEDRLAGRCGIDDWLLCYASFVRPDACTPLPVECKPAFCAWAACAKQPVSNCE